MGRATKSYLECDQEGPQTWKPSTFECIKEENIRKCTAPKVENGGCKEGPYIEAGDKCTALCVHGYRATKSHLKCDEGSLTLEPSTFECNIAEQERKEWEDGINGIHPAGGRWR